MAPCGYTTLLLLGLGIMVGCSPPPPAKQDTTVMRQETEDTVPPVARTLDTVRQALSTTESRLRNRTAELDQLESRFQMLQERARRKEREIEVLQKRLSRNYAAKLLE